MRFYYFDEEKTFLSGSGFAPQTNKPLSSLFDIYSRSIYIEQKPKRIAILTLRTKAIFFSEGNPFLSYL